MDGLLPEVEGWIKIAGAVVAVLMAVLVPVRSWLVEDRRFRAETLEAIADASRNAVAGLSAPSTLLADSLAVAALAQALDRVASALERLLAAGDDRDRDRLTTALERFLEAEKRRGGSG